MYKRRFRFLIVFTVGIGLGLAANAQPGSSEKQPLPEIALVYWLADNLERPDISQRAKKVGVEYGGCGHMISRVFNLKRLGGAGIGSAVQAGHQDSIEALIQDWSGPRPPSKDELLNHQKDLSKVARVVQAMAEVAPYRVIHFNPRSPGINLDPDVFNQRFQKVAGDFKAAAGEFRQAIETADPSEVRKAAVSLQLSCKACHSGLNFR